MNSFMPIILIIGVVLISGCIQENSTTKTLTENDFYFVGTKWVASVSVGSPGDFCTACSSINYCFHDLNLYFSLNVPYDDLICQVYENGENIHTSDVGILLKNEETSKTFLRIDSLDVRKYHVLNVCCSYRKGLNEIISPTICKNVDVKSGC